MLICYRLSDVHGNINKNSVQHLRLVLPVTVICGHCKIKSIVTQINSKS